MTLYSQLQKNIEPFLAPVLFLLHHLSKKKKKPLIRKPVFLRRTYTGQLRCQRKGYNIVYDPSRSVKHESGAATKKSYGTEKKRIRFMMEKTVGACEVYLEMLGEE